MNNLLLLGNRMNSFLPPALPPTSEIGNLSTSSAHLTLTLVIATLGKWHPLPSCWGSLTYNNSRICWGTGLRLMSFQPCLWDGGFLPRNGPRCPGTDVLSSPVQLHRTVTVPFLLFRGSMTVSTEGRRCVFSQEIESFGDSGLAQVWLLSSHSVFWFHKEYPIKHFEFSVGGKVLSQVNGFKWHYLMGTCFMPTFCQEMWIMHWPFQRHSHA